ncbi:MAG: alpha/beta fold hydrolase [Sphingobium sp.]
MVRVPHAVGRLLTVGAALALAACAPAADRLATTANASLIDQRYLTSADRHIVVDGISYRVREEGPADGAPIVLLHGFSFSLESWDKWAADLAQDHRVIRFDLAGHGLSGPAPDNRYDAKTRIGHILKLMDALGIAHATFAGNSYGGLLAWNIAAAHPQRVDHLILVDSAAFSINAVTEKPAPVPQIMRAYLLDPKPDQVKGSAGLIFADLATVPPKRLEVMRDMIARPGNGRALIAHLEQFTLPAPEHGLASISAPTLIVWGRADRVIPVEQASRLHDAIRGSQLIIYDNVGHAPQEEAADRSLKDVRKFLTD